MPTTVTLLAAGLGANHGYTIDGDSVHLHADLVLYDATAAASRDWSLQLWACDDAFSGGVISGHLAAEIGIGSLAGFGETPTPLHATTAFHPPSGGGTFTLVLLLVAAPSEITDTPATRAPKPSSSPASAATSATKSTVAASPSKSPPSKIHATNPTSQAPSRSNSGPGPSRIQAATSTAPRWPPPSLARSPARASGIPRPSISPSRPRPTAPGTSA